MIAGRKMNRLFSCCVGIPEIAEYLRRNEFMMVLVVMIYWGGATSVTPVLEKSYLYSRIVQYLVESSSIVVSMAMTDDDRTNYYGRNAHSFQMIARERWRVHHDTSTAHPKDVA